MDSEITEELYHLCNDEQYQNDTIIIQIDTKQNSFRGILSKTDCTTGLDYIKLTETWVGKKSACFYKTSYIQKSEIVSFSYKIVKYI